jgi:GTPase
MPLPVPSSPGRAVEIAVFGRISVGKSALLNAVFETNAFIVDPRGGSTLAAQRIDAYLAGHRVAVIDTPGIGEVRDRFKAEEAKEAAYRADLVVVVCDKDVTDFEHAEIEALIEFGKPLLVVLNKADTLSLADRKALLAELRQRLSQLVEPSHVLVCAASPIRLVARERADGTLEERAERTTPDVLDVRSRIVEVLQEEADLLKQVNEAAHGVQAAVQQREVARRRAHSLIEEHALLVAVGVAINPVPLVDLFGGGAALVVLVNRLATCYGLVLHQHEVEELARLLISRGWSQLWVAALPIVAGAVLKAIPFVGWLFGALGQAVGAYYLTYILGQVCSEYFARNREWATSLEETLRSVIARTDRETVSRQAAEVIRDRLKSSRN